MHYQINQLKVLDNWSEKLVTMLLYLLKGIFHEDETLPYIYFTRDQKKEKK